MASYTETAVLKLIDEASDPIRKVNRELKKLMTTAEKFRSETADFAVNAKARR
jgi:hypothetical protein